MLSHLSRKASRKTTSTDAAVKKVSRYKAKTQEKKLDQSTSCREAIEDPGIFLIDSPSYRGSVEIVIRKGLKARQIARCRDCLKTIFQEGKNTDMNAIKHATQRRIQSTFQTLKNISQ